MQSRGGASGLTRSMRERVKNIVSSASELIPNLADLEAFSPTRETADHAI